MGLLTNSIDSPKEHSLANRCAEGKASGHRAPYEAADAGDCNSVIVVTCASAAKQSRQFFAL